MEKETFNATCLITGDTNNLRMHALRNNNGDMIGWVFLNERVKVEEIEATVDWKFKVEIKK